MKQVKDEISMGVHDPLYYKVYERANPLIYWGVDKTLIKTLHYITHNYKPSYQQLKNETSKTKN